MKFVITLTIFYAIFQLATAASYTEHYFRDEKYPGKCYIHGKVVAVGQSVKHPTKCAEITCDNSIGLGTIETCDPVSALTSPLQSLKTYDTKNPPKCTWGDFKDVTLSYPQCCERHFTCVF